MTACRPIVGVCGYAGAGKSTIAQALVGGHGFELVRFAGPLKAMAEALGLSREQVDGALKETPSDLLCGKTPRHAMQTLGTEWGRNSIGPDLWTNAWRHRVDALAPAPIVADDVRFENERDLIRSMGGVIWWVERPGVAPQSGHVSENIMSFKSADLVLVNNGTIGKLCTAIAAATRTLDEPTTPGRETLATR